VFEVVEAGLLLGLRGLQFALEAVLQFGVIAGPGEIPRLIAARGAQALLQGAQGPAQFGERSF
jgi:hypothetical protein